MNHPGFSSPLAEDNGLIIPIGRMGDAHRLRRAQRWQTRFGLNLRVGVEPVGLQFGSRTW